MSLPMANKPTLIEWGSQRFLIMDAPKKHNLHLYIKEMKAEGVTDVVRVCHETYPASDVEAAGIRVHELAYEDGAAPPDEIISAWLRVVNQAFKNARDGQKPTVAVHCVAGLGRAPVMVAIAVIETGADPLNVVNYIRQRRRGAINTKQLEYLETYARKTKAGCCTIC
ncbi:unnamed protein product [Heterosigma akashiwo]|mmetsp:Transcript_23232/g.32218  ORF Transcript_23232/g.32218 Transcript_23232/m.32218 type:complete len:168 (-) Transcript_23232:189-692(-)|eukprot:CAMPEP_0194583292 /NCGR_PEP_ID=MMETSP0292-20121207/16231_1 /TAXON_ID=39354 /ORGANISM="Heterosigma akashiwo, Strain CCMP2393" /LENGTH=167 /DNA_ID=CAMNT_0039437843 /DNA_START=412 /DNA_END=915 /DNA_ORIENTATION=+